MRIRNKTIDNLCIFLKLFYEETKDAPKTGYNIQSWAIKLGVPYSHTLSQTLRDKGIICLKQGNRFKPTTIQWVSTTEPNRVMATEILKICAKKHNVAHHNENDEETQEHALTQTCAPQVTPFFKVLLSDEECTRIKALNSNEDLRYIKVVLDNGMVKIRQTFFKDTQPLPFAKIHAHLLQSKYDDCITHIELTNFVVKGQVINKPVFVFEGDM
jgi:hypothetical protein